MARSGFFRTLRITVLLYILAMVALGTWLSQRRSTDWDASLWVDVYAIAGDAGESTARYLERLDDQSFASVEAFFSREAKRYGLVLERPVRVELAGILRELPPRPPAQANPWQAMRWSLNMRYWAYSATRAIDRPTPDIQVFVIYHDSSQEVVLDRSVALRKGLIGVVNGFASRNMAQKNNFIIAHELLHTLGASDKYELTDNQPIAPDGLADPDIDPLYPQSQAEIMGGRIALAPDRADMPAGLRQTVVGAATAREINWLE